MYLINAYLHHLPTWFLKGKSILKNYKFYIFISNNFAQNCNIKAVMGVYRYLSVKIDKFIYVIFFTNWYLFFSKTITFNK